MAKAKDLATLDIDDIIREAEFQQRAGGCNPETVEAMAEALKAKPGCLPRVKVYCVKDIGYILTDGFQRCEAHEKAGLGKIQAEVRHGTRFDAEMASGESNREHDSSGDKRTSADKRRAVCFVIGRLAIAKEDWTDKRIADHVGVSATLVKQCRPSVKNDLLKSEKEPGIPLDDPPMREARDGRKFSAPAPAAPKEEPSLSSLDSDDPGTTPLAEFLDVAPEVWDALDRSRVVTVGDLDARLKNKETFGLTMDDIAHLKKECASIMSGAKKVETPKPPVKKVGAEKGFDFREWDRAYGTLIQGFDTIAGMVDGEKQSLQYREGLRLLTEAHKMWHLMHGRLKLSGYTPPR